MTENEPTRWHRTKHGLALLPSLLLSEAMADLAKTEAADEYVVDMLEWHTPRKENGKQVCLVCLAGTVVAQRFPEVSPTKRFLPYDTADPIERRLLSSLDAARRCYWSAYLHDVDQARKVVGLPPCGGYRADFMERMPYLRNDAYHTDPEQFKRAMDTAASTLRSAGI